MPFSWKFNKKYFFMYNIMMNYSQLLSNLEASEPIDKSIVNTLYALSEKSLLTTMIFSIFLMVSLYSELSYGIILWGIILIIISGIRLYYARLFKRFPSIYTIELWYKKFTILAYITGIIVSTLGFIFIHYLNDYYQLFILSSLLGFTAGATISLSLDFRIAIIYISIIILPLIFSLAIQNTPLNIIVPLILILFYFSQVIMILKNYNQERKIRDLVEDIHLCRSISTFISCQQDQG